jgi:CubicO group peptidase (beta-lactamase class C family)
VRHCRLAATLRFAGALLPMMPAAAVASPLEPLDAIVRRGMAEQRYPGAVLLVGRGERTLFARAYGRHTYDADSPPMRMDTLFDMASVSKVAGGTPATMALMEDRRIGLDDPVSHHLFGFGVKGKETVTVRDLLTHVSGLKAYESFATVEKGRRTGESHADALYRHYAALPATYPPRTKMVYSCLNLQTMAGIVQKIAGEPLEELLRRRVWRPLGMKDTTYRPSAKQAARCAPTGVGPDGKAVRASVHDPLANYHGSETLCPGNAGLYSTAPDLARYAQMILGDGSRRGRRVFRPETIRLMTTIQTPEGVTPPRSIGWGVYVDEPQAGPIQRDPTRRTIGHTGYTGTWLWLDPATRAYIVFLTNRVYPSPATNGGEGAAIDRIRADIARTVVAALRPPSRDR